MFTNTDLLAETENLRRFACKLTRNLHDAEDLLQSTLLRALEKKHLFKSDTNLFSWTSKIMFNLFVSGYRRKTKFETQYDPEAYIERERVEADQDVKAEIRDVQDAMNRLSQEHKDILIMICVKGMAYAEVAEELKIPVGTVRSRLSRARENMQAILTAAPSPTAQGLIYQAQEKQSVQLSRVAA